MIKLKYKFIRNYKYNSFLLSFFYHILNFNIISLKFIFIINIIELI